MDAPDCGKGTTPPFDGVRAYLQAVQGRDDLNRIRQLKARNDGLKRSVQRLPMARCASDVAPPGAWWKRVLRTVELKK